MVINLPITDLERRTDKTHRAAVERMTAGGHETNSIRRRSDLLSFLPGEQLVNDSEVDNGQKSTEPVPSALSDMMDALVPSWPKDGRMSPQKQKHQQEDQQPLDDLLLLAPKLPTSARISGPIEESSVQQEQAQQQQPHVEAAPLNRRKSVRFKSPDETFHDQVQGASASLAGHLSSPDPLASALPLRNAAPAAKSATSIAATTTKPSNRVQRARRASRGGRRLTVALGLNEKGELNDDNYNEISYPDLTTKAPRDSPYVSVSQQESSSAIAVFQTSEDSDTIAVAPRKSTRKRALKDFGDVEVGYPKKKSTK